MNSKEIKYLGIYEKSVNLDGPSIRINSRLFIFEFKKSRY